MADSFDLTDLAKAWDEIESIRERLRDAKKPFLFTSKSGSGDSSILECTKNQDVLTPMLHRFFAARLKLPDIRGLRAEIEITYGKASREPSESDVDDDGWDLRGMLRFLKRKAQRNDPSTDSRLS